MILQHRVTVKFDPSSKEHRDAVRKYMKRRAWVDSPLWFTDDDAFASVPDQVYSKLLAWYLEQEQITI